MKIRQYQQAPEIVEKDKLKPWQKKLHEIIFEAETFWGTAFDIALLVAILLSVLAVMLESIPSFSVKYGEELFVVDWTFTFLFSIEYILRILCIGKPIKYVLSFYGLIDLLSILPSYLGLFFTGTHSLSVIRSLRLLRIFRIFKLGRYVGEGRALSMALRSSFAKIIVFLMAVMALCIIFGTVMYLVESPTSGFTNIPKSIYWAIVTLTTVGYGDISPETPLGQGIASIIMIMGYSIIAVPTGLVTVALTRGKDQANSPHNTVSCPSCSKEGHAPDAIYCKYCGQPLEP